MAGRGDEDILRYFRKGAKVEASSDDPGFRDSWYEATVIEPAESEFSKALVEYKTLKKDNKGKRPLKESVRLVLLRPLPPLENRSSYGFNDAVDAYYSEGWWEGYITKIYKRNRYKVFFRGTGEEMKFPASELRLHREWVKGRWIPPLDSESERAPSSSIAEANIEGIECTFNSDNRVEAIKGVTERIFKPGDPVEAIEEVFEHVFKPGDPVEACSEEEGLEGARFSATIVEELAGGKYIIEYKTLRNDDDTGFLREVVDRLHLRPSPPDVGLVDSFVVDEEVDAFFNDCWWVGVISKVLKNDKYYVYFENTDERLKFEHSDLRVHQEWKNGKWLISSRVDR